MFHTLNQNHNYDIRAAINYQLDFAAIRTTHYEIYPFRKRTPKRRMKSKEWVYLIYETVN